MKKWDREIYGLTIFGTLVALIVMIAYNYASFYSNMVANMQDIGTSSLAQATEQLEGYLQKSKDVLQTTTVSVEYMMENGATPEEIEKFLVYESKRYTTEIDKNFTGIYGWFDGEYLDGIGWVPEPGYIPREREWYVTAEEAKGAPVLVSPYLDAQTGTIMVSVSQLLRDGDSVISLDIVMDEIQNITQNIDLGDAGYGFVVDKAGLVVAHKDAAEKGKNYLQEDDEKHALLERVYEKESACFRVDLDGKTYTVFTDTVMEDWHVVMVVDNNKILADVKMTLTRNVAICSIIAILIVAFYIITFRKMENSMQLERESNQKVEQMNRNMVRALAKTIDAKDRYTNGHSLRVADYAKEIARRMGKSEKEQEDVFYAGLLHDIGKIRVPEEVINSSNKLTEEEFNQIKLHPVSGYHILKDIYEDKLIATGAKFHHERYDGRGYPNGIQGENIPEIARIIGVADSYDAMASNRSYRKALPQEVVRGEIEKGKGTQFDPEIADIMLQMIDEDKEYSMKENDNLQKTILIVDDEPMNIKMTEFIMKDEPIYRIIGAAGGEEALDILKTESVDLVLLDVMMPGMDGFETLERIREDYQMPVAFMTGEKSMETIQKAASFGVDDYITKPFLPLSLKEVVHSILNN